MPTKKQSSRKAAVPERRRKPQKGDLPVFHPVTEAAIAGYWPDPPPLAALFVDHVAGQRLDPRLVRLVSEQWEFIRSGFVEDVEERPPSHEWGRREFGEAILARESSGEPVRALDALLMETWSKRKSIFDQAVRSASIILSAAHSCLDTAFFRHLADVIDAIRTQKAANLRDHPWLRFVVAYVSARYLTNGIMPPSFKSTRLVLESLKDDESARENRTPDDFEVVTPTWDQIQAAFALPECPTTAEVARALTLYFCVGFRLANEYSRRFDAGTQRQKDSVEAQIRKVCSKLQLPLKKGSTEL